MDIVTIQVSLVDLVLYFLDFIVVFFTVFLPRWVHIVGDLYIHFITLALHTSTNLWTAHKVVIKGHLFNLATKPHRTKLADLRSLTKTLDCLYNRYNQSPIPERLEQINSKKSALDFILFEDTEKALRWSRAKFLLFSNSASTMFARKLGHMVKPPHV